MEEDGRGTEVRVREHRETIVETGKVPSVKRIMDERQAKERKMAWERSVGTEGKGWGGVRPAAARECCGAQGIIRGSAAPVHPLSRGLTLTLVI